MAAYKKIQGNPIKPQGGKPATNLTGVVGHPKSGVHVNSTLSDGRGKNSHWMGSGASGKKTVQEARGKHLA